MEYQALISNTIKNVFILLYSSICYPMVHGIAKCYLSKHNHKRPWKCQIENRC